MADTPSVQRWLSEDKGQTLDPGCQLLRILDPDKSSDLRLKPLGSL